MNQPTELNEHSNEFKRMFSCLVLWYVGKGKNKKICQKNNIMFMKLIFYFEII